MRPAAFAVAIEIACLSIVALGFPKRVDTGPNGVPASVRLIAESGERETTQLTDLRKALETDTRDHERTPHIVATGETPLMTLSNRTARLYGDSAGTKGFSVDNFLL